METEILKTAGMAVFSAVTLFILAKIMGHKQIAQLDFFDYVAGITIGSIAAEMATELEAPLQPLVAMIVYGVIAFLLSMLSLWVIRSRKYLNGTPTILFSDGKFFRANLKKAKLDLSEFMLMCRQQGYFDLSQIHLAVFEYNGRISISPKSDQRPATPADLQLSPPPASIFCEVIMDGHVLEGNLQRMGLNRKWLQKQLTAQGFSDPKEIFLGLCDTEKQLSLYTGL